MKALLRWWDNLTWSVQGTGFSSTTQLYPQFMVVIFCWSFIILAGSIDYSPGNSPGNRRFFVHKQGDLLGKWLSWREVVQKKVLFCPGFLYCFTLSGDRVFWALDVGRVIYKFVCVFLVKWILDRKKSTFGDDIKVFCKCSNTQLLGGPSRFGLNTSTTVTCL